jgi:hypothetical protein
MTPMLDASTSGKYSLKDNLIVSLLTAINGLARSFPGLCRRLGISLSLMPRLPRKQPKVKFATTEGDFVLGVYPDKAPKMVENFSAVRQDKHYDGLIFSPRHQQLYGCRAGGYDLVEKPPRPPVVHEEPGSLGQGGARMSWCRGPPMTPTRPRPSSSSTSATTF